MADEVVCTCPPVTGTRLRHWNQCPLYVPGQDGDRNKHKCTCPPETGGVPRGVHLRGCPVLLDPAKAMPPGVKECTCPDHIPGTILRSHQPGCPIAIFRVRAGAVLVQNDELAEEASYYRWGPPKREQHPQTGEVHHPACNRARHIDGGGECDCSLMDACSELAMYRAEEAKLRNYLRENFPRLKNLDQGSAVEHAIVLLDTAKACISAAWPLLRTMWNNMVHTLHTAGIIDVEKMK